MSDWPDLQAEARCELALRAQAVDEWNDQLDAQTPSPDKEKENCDSE